MAKITVEKAKISVIQINEEDFISLTDIAHSQMEEHIIIKWLSLKSTIEYIGEWEALFNPNFNYTEFGTIKNAAGSNNFVLSVKQWIERTGAIGITAKAGLINDGIPQRERLLRLNKIAIQQMTILVEVQGRKLLK
jgi:hypothetical protein